MRWDQSTWNHDLYATVKKYIALRKKYAALWRRGEYAHLYSQGRVYVFARRHAQHTVIVGLNAGHQEVVVDLDVHLLLQNGARVCQEWGDAQRMVTDGYVRGLTIPARDGSVWVSETCDVS
jgi:cyclomaltodextrinase / maltogenic alpha-amylase / neopullulanase